MTNSTSYLQYQLLQYLLGGMAALAIYGRHLCEPCEEHKKQVVGPNCCW